MHEAPRQDTPCVPVLLCQPVDNDVSMISFYTDRGDFFPRTENHLGIQGFLYFRSAGKKAKMKMAYGENYLLGEDILRHLF